MGEKGKILTIVDLSCSLPCVLFDPFACAYACISCTRAVRVHEYMWNASTYQREPECVAIVNGLAGLDGPVINCVTRDYITDAADPLYYIWLYVRVAGGIARYVRAVRVCPLPDARARGNALVRACNKSAATGMVEMRTVICPAADVRSSLIRNCKVHLVPRWRMRRNASLMHNTLFARSCEYHGLFVFTHGAHRSRWCSQPSESTPWHVFHSP